jgi:hypothetical protein
MLIHYYAVLWGTAIIVVGCIGWNIYVTCASNYQLNQHPWGILRAETATSLLLLFVGYGNFAGPKWGDDNPRTKGLTPIDGTDEAAFEHDVDMEYAKTLSNPVSRRDAKTTGDWLFIGRIWTRYSRAHPFYVPGASAGFLFRIVGRTLLRS